MATIDLHLFGAPRVNVNGAPTAIRRRKALALLAYLAVTQQPHSRETLAAMLWPESGESHARSSLRRHLSELNKKLGDDRIIADRTSVRVVRGHELRVDVVEFRTLLARCRMHGHTSETMCATCMALLEDAAALYEYDFLRGFTLEDSPGFDEWQRYETEGLRAGLATALQHLGRTYARQGHFVTAIGHVRRWVAMDPLHDSAQRLLVQLYVDSGNPFAAKRQYGEYAELLEVELGVAVEQSFADFYRAIHEEQRPKSPDARGEIHVVQQDGAVSPASALPAFLRDDVEPAKDIQLPFVARDHRISELSQFLDAALSGSGQVVFVAGEAGSGKSSLLQEFAHCAQETHKNLIVAQGTCDVYTGVGDPYLPFRDILQMLSGDVEQLWSAGAITRDHALRLWKLLPRTVNALLEFGPDLVSTLLSPAIVTRVAAQEAVDHSVRNRLQEILERTRGQRPDQGRLFEQYTHVLRSLAADHPLLLLLDDLHWADVSSISLIFHLSRRITDSRILVVGAYRPEEIAIGVDGRPHPLEQVLGELKGRSGELEINLDQEMTAEGRHFVDALLDVYPNRLHEGFRQALFRHSRGHALFTVELLRDLQESGDLLRDEQGRWIEGPHIQWEMLPARVEGVIAKRINRLSGELHDTLTAASVEGERFTAEVLARVQATDAGKLIHQLSAELERKHRLVRAVGVRQIGNRRLSRYRFRHNLFQLYLHDNLDPVRRAYLHEQVGRALEEIYREQDAETDSIAGQLARHFEEAGEIEKATGYRYMAGQRAIHLSANHEAIEHLNTGLTLLRSLPKSHENMQRELRIRIALGVPITAVYGYANPQAESIYSAALELCRTIGDTAQLFPALYGLWRYYAMRAELGTSLDVAERLMRLAQDGGDRSLMVEAERAVGISRFHLGDLRDAREHLERGVALYDVEEDQEHAFVYGHDPLVSCLGYLALTLWLLGYPDQALGAVKRLLPWARELSHPFSLAHAMTVGALQTYQHRGEVQPVDELAPEALALADELGFPFWIGRAKFFGGWAIAVQGEQEAGIAQMREGVDTWRRTGTEAVLPYFLGLLAEANMRAGEIEAAEAMLEEAVSVMQSNGERWWQAELYRLQGDLQLAADVRDPAVESHYRLALETARQQQAKSLELRAAMSLSRLWRQQGKHAEARDVLAEAYVWFTEGFDTRDLKDASRLLDLLGFRGCEPDRV